MADGRFTIAGQFDDIGQQRDAATLGMWVFLATEVLFFGGMFLGYVVYRTTYPEVFASASRFMNITLGGINTAVLLCSSLTMALAVHSAQQGKHRKSALFLLATMLLGLVFLGIKAVEYTQKFEEHLFPGVNFHYDGPGAANAQIYFVLYFLLTGFHALHLVIGEGILSVMAVLTIRRRFTTEYYAPVEISGLYWHFVDIVWIFLYPLIYLIRAYR